MRSQGLNSASWVPQGVTVRVRVGVAVRGRFRVRVRATARLTLESGVRLGCEIELHVTATLFCLQCDQDCVAWILVIVMLYS